MHGVSDITEDNIEFSCKRIQKDGNNVHNQKFHNVLFNKHIDQVLNKAFRYVDGYMKSYEQSKNVYLIQTTRELCVKMVLQQKY